MDDQSRCQSCGMPLNEGGYGTEADGTTVSREYCTHCYQHGRYTEPNLTLREMIQKSVAQMVGHRNLLEYQARRRAEMTIPTLKRWQSGTLQTDSGETDKHHQEE